LWISQDSSSLGLQRASEPPQLQRRIDSPIPYPFLAKQKPEFESLAIYPDRDRLRTEYPELEPDDIRQALEFAASTLDDKVIPLENA